MRLFFLLAFILQIAFADVYSADTTGIVKGRVFDFITGDPLVGANILYGKNLGTISGKDGKFFFRTAKGNVNVTFQYIGYQQQRRTIFLTEGDTVEVNAGMIHEINQIDQIVVSANRNEQKLSESTVSLSIIRPGILSENHITDAEELINKSSGIEVLDGQASIRGGSGFSYGAGSRVLALIDGLPVVAADAGNIKWQFLPLENLAQVEIIKGASSVLYGSSALNGIINFRTADATATPQTRFFIESGLYDNPRQNSWKWWDTPRMTAAASFSHLQKSGNTDIGVGSSILFDNGYRKWNDEKLGRLNISLKHHNPKVKGLTYGMNINSGYTVKRDFVLWEDAAFGALKQDESTVLQLQGSFLALDPFISLKKANLYRHELRTRLQSSRNTFPDKPGNNSDALSFYAEYQSWHKLSDIFDFNLGVSENFSRITSNFYGDHEGLNLAALAQFNLKPVERLIMIAGVRFEFNSLDGKNDKIVPVFRTGINYKLADYSYLRLSFGQGYRYPSIAEKFASTTLGTIKIFPNPYIQAESGWNSEIGVKQGIVLGNFSGQADLAVFYTQNSELIEYIFGSYRDPVTELYDFGFKATNVEQSRVYGYEVEYMLKQSSGDFTTSFSGGYIFMYPVEFNPITKKNTDTFLKYRRKHSGKLSVNTSYKKYALGLNFFAKSRMLSIDDVFLGELTRETILPGFYDYWNKNNQAYMLMDVAMSYEISDRYAISFSVKNITNVEYMGRPGDIRPQRNFGLRFNGNF